MGLPLPPASPLGLSPVPTSWNNERDFDAHLSLPGEQRTLSALTSHWELLSPAWHCHTPLSPAWLMAFVSQLSPISSKSSSAPPQRVWGGYSHPALPLWVELWTFQSLQKSCSHCPREPQRDKFVMERQVCYGEAKSHFSTLNILWLCPLHSPVPSSVPARLAANTKGFSSPLQQMFHLLLLGP